MPPLGTTFDTIQKPNNDDQQQTQRAVFGSDDFYQQQVDCFQQRPIIQIKKQKIQDIGSPLSLFQSLKKSLQKNQKLLTRNHIHRLQTLKTLAYLCMRQVDRRCKRSQRIQNQWVSRSRRVFRQGVLYWRRRDKQLAQLKKKKDRIQNDIKKRNQQKLEQETQKKKLQYLMKQSVLYSHFMAKKLGMETSQNKQLQMDDKNLQIDQQAAQLNVNQIISKKRDNIQNFDGANGLDFSKVQDQDQQAQINGPPPIFHGKLKDYQTKGLKWMYNLSLQGINGILADEMGLGKTIQAISLLSSIAYMKNRWGPFLIISPTSTLHNWQQQFKRFCPALKILPYWGGIKQRKIIRKNFSTKKFTSKQDSPFHLVITSYQLAVSDQKTFRRLKWQFIVLDQAHNIKNTMSQRWNVLKQFQSRSRLLLTGTPIQNNMAQLWALLNFIMPQLFDSHQQFNQWFSKDIQAHSQDQKQLDMIQIQRLHAILKPFMLRRVKKDVQHQIGKKHQYRILCQMTKRQKSLYQYIKQKLNVKQLFKMMQSKNKVQNLMNLVMQLRKVCNHPQLFQRRPPLSSYLFQQPYFYTGGVNFNIKTNQMKQLSFDPKNPIQLNIPKLVYDTFLRYNQSLQKRNIRLCDLFKVSYMKQYGFHRKVKNGQMQTQIFDKNYTNSLSLLGLSWSQLKFVFKQDQLLSSLCLTHWLKNRRYNNYNPNLSTKQNIYFMHQYNENRVDERFIFDPKKLFNQISKINQIYIQTAVAPMIDVNISSFAHVEQKQILKRNKLQKFVMQGKYKQKYNYLINKEQQFDGILPKNQFLTKIQLVNFGSLVADSAKLNQLDRILKQKKAVGDKVLIFCQMTKMLDILQDFMNMKKYSFFRLDGACSLSDRRDMVNQFQRQNSKVFVFLLSTRAGGLGVTLTAANNVVFYDNDWNPTMDAQATDRAHRIGQTRDVYVYQLVTKNTIQDRIVKRAEQKKTVQSTVYQGGSLNIFKKDIMELMADQLGVQGVTIQDQVINGKQKKQQQKGGNIKKRGPKAIKPTIGKTKNQKTF